MATVYPISGAQPSTKTDTSTASTTDNATSSNSLNENTFLTLLVAQLKYQDPMNPADSTQFLTQTAQFTEVETLQKMATQQAAQQAASQLLAASTMIGRPVSYSLTAGGAAGTPTPTSVMSVRGTLPSDAAVGTTETTTTNVFTKAGTKIPLELDFTKTSSGWTVQALSNGSKLGSPIGVSFNAAGDKTINDVVIPASTLDGAIGTAGDWPATGITLGFGSAADPTRLQLASASTVAIVEQDGNDGQTATGVVTGVHLTADGPQLLIGGQQIPYTSITDVQS
jgi:flagellar basal-body rod modification protein FlgD